jgi:hypothetical protein
VARERLPPIIRPDTQNKQKLHYFFIEDVFYWNGPEEGWRGGEESKEESKEETIIDYGLNMRGNDEVDELILAQNQDITKAALCNNLVLPPSAINAMNNTSLMLKNSDDDSDNSLDSQKLEPRVLQK